MWDEHVQSHAEWVILLLAEGSAWNRMVLFQLTGRLDCHRTLHVLSVVLFAAGLLMMMVCGRASAAAFLPQNP